MKRRVLLSSGALLVTLPFIPSLVAAQGSQRQDQQQQQNQQQNQLQDQSQSMQTAEVRSFTGRISQRSGKFYLEDPTHKQSFLLDSEWLAKRNMGLDVQVKGALDENTNTIRVRSMTAVKPKNSGSPPKPAVRE